MGIRRLAGIVPLLVVGAVILGCVLLPGPQPEDDAAVRGTLERLQETIDSSQTTAMAEEPTQAEPSLPVMEGGIIEGTLSYPSEFIPELLVVVFEADTLTPVVTLETGEGQGVYSLGVPEGVYHVVAYTEDGAFAGGYTAAVPCGLSVDCIDHSLIPIEVAEGTIVSGIDPADWYAPEGEFPPSP